MENVLARPIELNLWNLSALPPEGRAVVDRLYAHDASLPESSEWSELLQRLPDLFRKVSPFHLMAVGYTDAPGARQATHALIQTLQAQGHALDQVDAYDWTPLCYAAWYGRAGLVDLLLECGADPNANDSVALSAVLAQVAGATTKMLWPPFSEDAVSPSQFSDEPDVAPHDAALSIQEDRSARTLDALWSPFFGPILSERVARGRARSDRRAPDSGPSAASDSSVVSWPKYAAPSSIPPSSRIPSTTLMDLSQYWLAPDTAWSTPHATCARLLLRAGARPGTQAPHHSGATVSSKRTWLAWALGAERFSWANVLWRHGARLTDQDRQALVLDGSPLPLAWCSLHEVSLAPLLGPDHEARPLLDAVDAWVLRARMAAACGSLPSAPSPDLDWLGWLSWLDLAAVAEVDEGSAESSSGGRSGRLM